MDPEPDDDPRAAAEELASACDAPDEAAPAAVDAPAAAELLEALADVEPMLRLDEFEAVRPAMLWPDAPASEEDVALVDALEELGATAWLLVEDEDGARDCAALEAAPPRLCVPWLLERPDAARDPVAPAELCVDDDAREDALLAAATCGLGPAPSNKRI